MEQRCSDLPSCDWLLSPPVQEEAELQSSGRISMYERAGLHFLEIKDVCVEDAGSYTCLLTNSAGTATASAALNIQGEPTNQSPGFVFITSCDDVNEVVLTSCFLSLRCS